MRLLLSKIHGLFVTYVHNLRIFVISFHPSLILELTRVDTTRTVVSNTLAYYVSEFITIDQTQARACFVVAPGDEEKNGRQNCRQMHAAMAGSVVNVRYLLNVGADIRMDDVNGDSAVTLACKSGIWTFSMIW